MKLESGKGDSKHVGVSGEALTALCKVPTLFLSPILLRVFSLSLTHKHTHTLSLSLMDT